MPKHRREMLTPYEPVTPLCPLGYASSGPARSLALLDVVGAMAASHRLRAHPVVRVTRLAPPLEQPARGHGGTRPSSTAF